MKNLALSVLLVLLTAVTGFASDGKYQSQTAKDANGYVYETFTNDPLSARIYTLSNGLKVFLTVNKDEPRIQTLIGVKAGSAYDPLETTGLAHYFEHLMFKGTSKIGTSNWENEKVLISEISALFEQHRATADTGMKTAIYHKIDSLSGLAASYAIPNEYDKLVSSMGAKGTNAGTAYDQTVYMNNIPMNELEKWAMLESERFGNIVLRLFHTELETVYEEFNMYQDEDDNRADAALMSALFPTHPYGREIIGLPEHLKNPSMVNINRFADTYYRSNNMAIALSGDLDFEKTILLIDKYFGPMKPGNIPANKPIMENPIETPVVKNVYGPDAENLMLAFRFDGDNSEDQMYVTLIDLILSNNKAGLIDLELVQAQKVLEASARPQFLKDYGMHVFSGKPREGQKLEEVRDLLLGQIEKIKKGEFEDWLLPAIIKDLRLSQIQRLESNFFRTYWYVDAFTKSIPYDHKLMVIDVLETITKEDLVKFANQRYKDNYVLVYKRTGNPENIIRMEKPPITAVAINRSQQSAFLKNFTNLPSGSINPAFIDFNEEIRMSELKPGINYFHIPNKTNELFYLVYIIDMGKDHDLMLDLAVNYLPYLGTKDYSAADLSREFFKIGANMSVNTGGNRSYISISGLEESLEPALRLLEHLIANVQPDRKAYDEYVQGILKKRTDDKLNKNSILWGAMLNYGKYGKLSPFTNILSEKQLLDTDPALLTEVIHNMFSYKHKIFYYGQRPETKMKELVSTYHKTGLLKEYPQPVKYQEQDARGNTVYLVDYDMVQANMLMLSKGPVFDKSLVPESRLFGEYFGSGLSSIVFQEIRESKALAYTAFASFSAPQMKDDSWFLYAFLGTQADKLKTATDAMTSLLNEMPRAERQFDLAKESILKQIESERITKRSIFWTYIQNMDKGIDYDIRKDVYEEVKNTNLDTFSDFFNKNIKGKNYTYLILGNKKNLDMEVVSKLGTIKELKLEELFNY